jgi:hypothetical protein
VCRYTLRSSSTVALWRWCYSWLPTYVLFLIFCAVLSQHAHYGWLKRYNNLSFLHILTDLQPTMLDCNVVTIILRLFTAVVCVVTAEWSFSCVKNNPALRYNYDTICSSTQSKRVHYFLLFFAWDMLQNVMCRTLTVSSASQLLPYVCRKRLDVEFLT